MPCSRVAVLLLILLSFCHSDCYHRIQTRLGSSWHKQRCSDIARSAAGVSSIGAHGSQRQTGLKCEPLAVSYLERELGLDGDTLKRIVLQHPWVLYLKVKTNVMPTIAVLESFGFSKGDVRKLISSVPSVLGISYNWTLPEKLMSLRTMFTISPADLPRLLKAQPYLLTSSVSRNQRTAHFFTDIMGVDDQKLSVLLLKEPKLCMSSATMLQRCWSVLTKLYGFTSEDTRDMVYRYPTLLSLQLVRGIKERLVLLSSELGVPSFPSTYWRELCKRFPPLLYIDTELFLRPNIETLRQLLNANSSAFGSGGLGIAAADAIYDVENRKLSSMVKVFPQLLGYNTDTLRRMCRDALFLLTGNPAELFTNSTCAAADEAENALTQWEQTVASMLQDNDISRLDLIAEAAAHFNGQGKGQRNAEQARDEARAVAALTLSASTLLLAPDRAVETLRRAPWILAYRTQRSQTVLAALAVSLGMSRAELSHCVSVYPR
jgi:hypothetical protein